jgi:hypothetical protein
LRAAGAETLTAKNWPSGRGLERHGIGFAALVAGNIEALALTSPAASAGAAKVCAARVPAGFTAFGLAQVPFLVVLLFALGKGKGLAAFGAKYIDVWHDWFLPSKRSASLLL